ncbi:hypothetical protein GQ53DRAFT_749569 [Thozetella sp. PMI_491]|nr:hypothetical protein GQ53DRAFT_749569 [Thozetella sp. PMI_491]
MEAYRTEPRAQSHRRHAPSSSIGSLYDVVAGLDETQLQYLIQEINHTGHQNVAVSHAVSAFETDNPTKSLAAARADMGAPHWPPLQRHLSKSQQQAKLRLQAAFQRSPSLRQARQRAAQSHEAQRRDIQKQDVQKHDIQEHDTHKYDIQKYDIQRQDIQTRHDNYDEVAPLQTSPREPNSRDSYSHNAPQLPPVSSIGEDLIFDLPELDMAFGQPQSPPPPPDDIALGTFSLPKLDMTFSQPENLPPSPEEIALGTTSGSERKPPAYIRIPRPDFELPLGVTVQDLVELLEAEYLSLTSNTKDSPTSLYPPFKLGVAKRQRSGHFMSFEVDQTTSEDEEIGLDMFEPRPLAPGGASSRASSVTPSVSRKVSGASIGDSLVLQGISDVLENRWGSLH